MKTINYSSRKRNGPDFILKGKPINLTCVVTADVPVTTSYLRVKNEKGTQKHFAKWESKKRICKNMDFNRTDCKEETSFQYSVKVTENGVYFCGFQDTARVYEARGLHVEVISSAGNGAESLTIFFF